MSNENWMGEPIKSARKDKGFIRSYFGYVVFFLGLFGFIAWGEFSKEKVQEREALHWAGLAALEVKQEVVQVNMTGVRLLGAVDSTGGRSPSIYRVWTALQAQDWLLLNGGQDNKLCRHVLGEFAKRNKLEEGSPIGPEALDVALTAMEGKVVPIGVYVPRFSAKPNGLEQCLGFAYEDSSRTLSVAGRTVALLADEQPGLTRKAQ